MQIKRDRLELIAGKLSNLQAVRSLTLNGTSVTSLGLETLEHCEALQKLDTARNSKLAREEITKLVEKLPGCDWLDRDAALARLKKAKA